MEIIALAQGKASSRPRRSDIVSVTQLQPPTLAARFDTSKLRQSPRSHLSDSARVILSIADPAACRGLRDSCRVSFCSTLAKPALVESTYLGAKHTFPSQSTPSEVGRRWPSGTPQHRQPAPTWPPRQRHAVPVTISGLSPACPALACHIRITGETCQPGSGDCRCLGRKGRRQENGRVRVARREPKAMNSFGAQTLTTTEREGYYS